MYWPLLTSVSASRNTHFSNCTRRQQWSFVKVTPNSGRLSRAKLAASCESSTFTSCTTLYTSFSLSRIASDTVGVTNTANWWAVPARLSECASTRAPSEYVSFVVSVTQANSTKGKKEIWGLNWESSSCILWIQRRAWDTDTQLYRQKYSYRYSYKCRNSSSSGSKFSFLFFHFQFSIFFFD